VFQELEHDLVRETLKVVALVEEELVELLGVYVFKVDLLVEVAYVFLELCDGLSKENSYLVL
jgi:hypothetical protein